LSAVSRSRPFPISDATFYAHLRRYGELAGLGRVSPHVLRHTAAKLRRQTGATIEEVSTMLGHQSIATTAVYLRRLEDGPDDGWASVAAVLAPVLADGQANPALGGEDSGTELTRAMHPVRQPS
jgi:integrase